MLQDEYYGPLNEKQAEYVNDIVQGAFQLNMLIARCSTWPEWTWQR